MSVSLSKVLFASVLSATPLFFATQSVQNSTPYNANVTVEYFACRSTKLIVAAGKTAVADGKACLVKAVRATVVQTEAGKAAVNVVATPFTSSGLGGNRTFILAGPTDAKYTVTRKP